MKNKERKKEIHDWFELSYAEYLIVPRSILQSMPEEWQDKFVKLLDELDDTFDWRRDGQYVMFKDNNGRIMPYLTDEFGRYERGRRKITPEESKEIVDRYEKYRDTKN